MKKFVLTSPKFMGSIQFWYNEIDLLINYTNETDLDETGHKWMLGNLPEHLSMLDGLKAKIKGNINELPPDLTFEAFYEPYSHKVQKKRALALWNKMNDESKLAAIFSVKPYLAYLQRVKWRNQADPDTYLRNAMYETDWNKQHK
ncbi:hypothetical protein QT327_21350 [Olivibacter sp. 47]|uniref:hypothetical protein n=1 Tax=Olivibacter sp. 47 TaxID=3056486 RepID=UPI0025A3E611|nr:hypothetical protein [Olivibacter sp. 47]MDM8176863.1 hypothetical protein [Olivibacter sp. 47]